MKEGQVIWITGLPGAGKSTISKKVIGYLTARHDWCLLLDGDKVRLAINDNLSHSPEDRLINASRISRLAQMLAEQNIIVVVATMSLYKEIHDWNRANLPNYTEVFIDVPIPVLIERDAKGLYAKFSQKGEKHMPGMDITYHRPSNPDLVIDNSEHNEDLSNFVLQIIDCADRQRR
jgi:adenylylsulfate kinase-like enzyme